MRDYYVWPDAAAGPPAVGWEGSHLVNTAAMRWHECQIAVHRAGTVVRC